MVKEAGFDPPAYATLKRRLPAFAKESWRQKLAAACARTADLGPASLVLYDVSTLYFETDAGDGFREPGFSEERRLEPQITIGLLTDASGFPSMVDAFEGNRGETTTMLPTIRAFMDAHQLADVTVVADAGMISAANQQAIEAARLSFILGARIPDVPYALEAKARALAGLKGYVSNLPDVTAEFVIDAYHRLFHIEKSFRMSEHDLRARPIYHHKRESIDAQLPHHQHPGRRAHPHRRRPATRRPPRCPHPHPRPRCALIRAKSGDNG